MKFKIGDRVIIKRCPEWGVGVVVEIDTNLEWPLRVQIQTGAWWRQRPSEVEHAETPIQRMKRRYEEEV